MYLMYVDESGDAGVENSPTQIFVLEGLVVHELSWQACLDKLVAFRQWTRQRYGLKLREEIHAGPFIAKPGDLARIPRNQRLAILGAFANAVGGIGDADLISIVVDKRNKSPEYDVFVNAWRALIMRFENTLAAGNFRGPANSEERGLFLPDNTDNRKLLRLLSRMRRFNPTPNQPAYGSGYRDLPLANVIERPGFQDSRHSYFIQACDLAAYLLYQELQPCSYVRRKGARGYFSRLTQICCTAAATKDPRGIVRL